MEINMHDLRDSVEYKWNIYSRNLLLWIYGILCIAGLLIACVSGMVSMSDGSFSWLGPTALGWLIVVAIAGCLFIPAVGIYQYKARRFLKLCPTLQPLEVVLDHPSTSFWYRRSVYYRVVIEDAGTSRSTVTPPYFSSGFAAPFPLEEFNNKTVLGAYDAERDRLYVIKVLR